MRFAVLAILGVMLAAPSGPASAEDGVEAGQERFLEACAGCHGVEARGDGPTAALLSVDVPDLTLFSARYGKEFDAVHMLQLIDGREGLAAHGGPMPMFGGLLTGRSVVLDGPGGDPVTTSEPILSIVRWLETQQRMPE